MTKPTTAASALAAILSAGAVHAAPILSGSFAGTAQLVSTAPGPPFPTYGIYPIAGSFTANLTNCTPTQVTPGYGQSTCVATPYAISFTYTYMNSTIVASGPTDTGYVFHAFDKNQVPIQQVAFLTSSPSATGMTGAAISFFGAQNEFINGVDFQSLQPGPVDPASAEFNVFYSPNLQLNTVLTSFTLVSPATAVPESSAIVMLLTLLGMAMTARRGRQRS